MIAFAMMRMTTNTYVVVDATTQLSWKWGWKAGRVVLKIRKFVAREGFPFA